MKIDVVTLKSMLAHNISMEATVIVSLSVKNIVGALKKIAHQH